MTVSELSDQEIAERLALLRGDSAEGGASDHGKDEGPTPLSIPPVTPTQYKFVRPLTDAADSLIEFFQNSDGRIMLGLPEIDILTRGFGPGELIYTIGYTHCVDPATEILTRRGWLAYNQLEVGDDAWSVNTSTGRSEWSPVSAVNVSQYSGKMMRLDGRTVSALVTPEHKWPTTSQWNVEHGMEGYGLTKTVDMNTSDYVPRAVLGTEPEREVFADELVRYVGQHPLERLTHEVVDQLTLRQRRLLVDLLFDGPDGYQASESARRYETIGSDEYVAKVGHLISAAGYAFSDKVRRLHSFGRYNGFGMMHIFTLHVTAHFRWARRKNKQWVDYEGIVWCPTTENGTWFARRNGTTYFTGNSGKTQVALTMMVNNRDKRFVLFTADEPAELVLTKLVCMRTGSNAERLEERVKAGDVEACARVRRIAREDFRNLIVIDQSMLRRDMSDAVKEAEDFWAAPVDCVVMDYLELFARAESCDVEEASQHLKGWALSHDFPTVVLHQGSRGNSAGGQVLTMRSMKYGGEQEAIFVLGVRRQRDDDDLDDHERMRHQDTVDISVLKNKRPPSKKGEHTFYMEPNSGLIVPLSHRPEAPSALRSARHLSPDRRAELSPGQRSFEEEDE